MFHFTNNSVQVYALKTAKTIITLQITPGEKIHILYRNYVHDAWFQYIVQSPY